MSGFNGKSKVKITAKKDQIIITKSSNPRASWEDQIDKLLRREADPSQELTDMKAADNDGLDDLAWDGPSFEEWHKSHG